jgi:hypothetical protein
MEDLLASIRKAIQEDVGSPPSLSGQSTGILYKGPTRELHVRTGEEIASAADEIQALRDRISQNRVAESYREPSPRLRGSLADELEARRLAGRSFGQDVTYHRPESPRALPPTIESQPAAAPPSWEDDPYRAPPPEPRYRAEPPIISSETAATAGAAFQKLADSILARATGDRSIEDITSDLLRGMLKKWLDDNLPALVERLVREEIERVARRGR